MNAREKAIERLALRLIMRRDMGSVSVHTEDEARERVALWDRNRRPGERSSLAPYVDQAEKLLWGLGLIAIDSALVEWYRKNGAKEDRDEILDAVLDQVRERR